MLYQHHADVQKSLGKVEISVTALYSHSSSLQLQWSLCLPVHNLSDFNFDLLIHVKVLT